MTVLVTGAAGRVGSRLVPRLLRLFGEIRILVRDPARAEPLVALGAEPVVGDLTDPGCLEQAVKGAHAVVHLATVFRPGPEIEAVNVTGTAALAQAALAAGTERFVYVSTNQVYGPGRGRPAVETDEPRPDRPYSQTKTAAERSLLALCPAGLGLRILRPPVIYGDGDPKLTEMVRFLDGPLHRRTQLVHHADVAQAVLLALRTPGVDGEIFNVGDDAPVTTYELLALNGARPPADSATEPLDDPWQSIIDSSKIRRLLGFRPFYPSLSSAADALAL
ncbi:MAG TPA: NAD(P)-dependent oxidoreductase [Jatrophihabitans sp.]|nr:NAD(P)-dependent oxidoreductase [Jatrophihabitans sp.]